MKFLRLLIMAVLLAGPPARADDAPSPEALQAASELFTVLSGDMLKQFIDQISNSFWPAVEQQARAEKIDDATIGELRREFDRIQLAFLTDAMKDAPAIYARHFTVAELRDLTAFYRTPTGVKALHEMPQVMGDTAALLVPRMPDLQRQISEAFTKVLQERGYGK